MKCRSILAAALAVLLLASCSNAPADTDTEAADIPAAADVGETEPAETEDSRLNVPDNLPEKKFDGQEFRVLTTTSKEYQFRVDELNGEVTNDSVFNRNQTVEDRFDAKIATIITADLPRAAQMTPGCTVRFMRVTVDQAQDILALQKAAYEEEYRLLNAIYPGEDRRMTD